MYRVEMNRTEVTHSQSIRWAVIVAADLLIALCSKKSTTLPVAAVQESCSESPTVTPRLESGGQPSRQQDQGATRSRSPVYTPASNLLSFGPDEASQFHQPSDTRQHHHHRRQARHDHQHDHAASGSSNHSSTPDRHPLERKSTLHNFLPGAPTASTSTGGYPTSSLSSTPPSSRRSRPSPTTFAAVPSRPHYLHLPDEPPTTSPMGCVFSTKRNKNHGLEGDIKVTDLHARIDPQPTTLIETSPTVLKYQTPHFRASAKVRFPPVSSSDTWEVGWVQGCSNMDFFITYGDLGISSWEIPALKSGQQRFVSDSDGKHYPWYGCTTEVGVIVGPTNCYTVCHLRMNDNFHPSITWDIPVRNSHEVKLTKLARDQSFTVWLIASNKTTGQKFVLRTIKWRMQINIAVDGRQPLGRRAHLLDPIIQEQPQILEPNQNELPPPEALRAPNANNAQTLIWRPMTGREVVIVPPVSQ